MRIVLPLFAFWAAGVASHYLVSDFRSGCKWNLRMAVFVIELPCLVLVGVALALGNFGPTVATLKVHSAASNLFNGGSIFTTVLFALFLREETEHLTKGIPRRSIWAHHWVVIFASGLFFLLWDLLMLMVAFLNLDWAVTQTIIVATYVISIPVQMITACIFCQELFTFACKYICTCRLREELGAAIFLKRLFQSFSELGGYSFGLPSAHSAYLWQRQPRI
jgi:hypothetical protein